MVPLSDLANSIMDPPPSSFVRIDIVFVIVVNAAAILLFALSMNACDVRFIIVDSHSLKFPSSVFVFRGLVMSQDFPPAVLPTLRDDPD